MHLGNESPTIRAGLSSICAHLTIGVEGNETTFYVDTTFQLVALGQRILAEADRLQREELQAMREDAAQTEVPF
jgi:hypothetical protein